MNTANIKNIFILLGGTTFILVLGIVLMLVKFPVWLNLIIYILLILGILWVSKKLYSSFNETSKPVAVFAFVMLGVFYIAMIIVKPLINIPNVCLISYEYTMGYLEFNGFLAASRVVNNKQIKIIGIIMFAISILVGICALFGMAK